MQLKKSFDIFFFIFLVILGIVLVNYLGRDTNWDLANYHYYSVYALFHNRIGYDIMPCGLQSYLNPILDIPLYFLIKYLNDYPRIIMSIQSLYWSFSAFLVYLIAKQIFKEQYSDSKYFWIFSALLGSTACVVIFELGCSMNDLPVTIFVLSSVLLFLKNLYAEDSKRRTVILTIAGLLLGMATGLKASAFLFVTSIVLSLIFLCKTYQKPIKIISLVITASIAGYLLTNGWWMYILYQKFQNPYFPYYNHIFKSSQALIESYMEARYFPEGISQWLFFPFYNKSFIIPCFDYRQRIFYIAFFLILIGKFLLPRFNPNFTSKLSSYINISLMNFLILFSVFSYLLWIKNSSVLRYFIPVLLLCGIFISVLFIYIKTFINSEKLTKILTCLTFCCFLFSSTYCDANMTRVQYNDDDKFLDFERFNLPDNSVILQLGVFPGQIFIPFQNPKARFIYIFGPKANNYIFYYSKSKEAEIKKIISEAGEKVFLLYSDWEPFETDWDYTSQFIDINKYDCKPAKNNFYQKYYFCSPNKSK